MSWCVAAQLARRSSPASHCTGTPFAGYRWEREIITLAVHWYCSYRLSAANMCDLLAERGLDVSARTALARALGYAVTAEATLSDTGPNATLARPGLTALLGLLATGAVAAVIVHTLDRLARPQSLALEALLTELRRRAVPLDIARAPKEYWYDPAAGTLLSDAQAVAAASREEWRPPEYIIIPREYDEAR